MGAAQFSGQYAGTWLNDAIRRAIPVLPKMYTEVLERSASAYKFHDMFWKGYNKPVSMEGQLVDLRLGIGDDAVPFRPFGSTTAPTVKNNNEQYTITHRYLLQSIAFDMFEKGLSKVTFTDFLKARMSANIEALANGMEARLLAMPLNASDNETVQGFPYHIRPAIDAAGTVVGTREPQKLGRHIKAWADGSTTDRSLYFGINRNDPRYATKLSNYAAVYSGDVDADLQYTMRMMRRKLNWSRLQGLQGDTSTMSGGLKAYKLFVPESLGVRLEDLADDTVEETGGDVKGVTRYKWQNQEVIESSTLDGINGRPIYLINPSQICGMHAKGSRFINKEVTPSSAASTTVVYSWMTFNLWCENPGTAGAVVHTSAI